MFLLAIAQAQGDFRVKFDIRTDRDEGREGTLRSFVIHAHDKWAPLGAAHFKELVEAKYYDDTRFFRVIPDFMVQFGISGDPEVAAEWKDKTIKDEPKKMTNKPGRVTFAKTDSPDSRTTQLFINTADNARLDKMGFAPFGEVEGDGMEVINQIYNCGEKPHQGNIHRRGNKYLDKIFPKLSVIVKATILDSTHGGEL